MEVTRFSRFFSIRALTLALVLIISTVVLLGVACNGGEEETPTPTSALTPTPTPAATPTPTSTSTPPDRVAEGKQLFIAKGCAGCHGANAEGTGIAPALAGHGEGEVKRQVRSPVGNMPSYDSDMVSDDELELIAHYIESLEYDGEHIEPVIMDEEAVTHHWMALYALNSGNVDEAVHHVIHIIEVVTDPEHATQMEEVLEHAQAGELHDASHAIEEMLAGKADPQLTMKSLHLRLALAEIRVDESAGARHHIEHFIELATDDEKARGEEILALLEQGNIHDAENEVEELLSDHAD